MLRTVPHAVLRLPRLTPSASCTRSQSACRFLHLSSRNHANALDSAQTTADTFDGALHSPQQSSTPDLNETVFPSYELGAIRAPVFPLPLQPSDATGTFSQHSLYPSSAAAEQLAILDACLRSNQLARAKIVWSRLRKLHETEIALGVTGENAADDEQAMKAVKMGDVVPASIHVAFLQAFFRSALAKSEFLSMETEVNEAWAWFDMLVKQGDEVGHPQAGAFATMIKGAIVCARFPYTASSF